MKELKVDIVIVGAGLIGLLTAHCLSLLKYNIIVVERRNSTIFKTNRADTRTVAVSEGSKQFLDNLSLWDNLKEYIEPIKEIMVFDRNSSNKILFENSDIEKKLGYVIENSKFSNLIFNKLKNKKNVKFLFGSELKKIETNTNQSSIYLKNFLLKSKLIIAADGKNSAIRKIAGNKIFKKNYSDSAMVINFLHENSLRNTAYEIFYNTGPLAILPTKSINKLFRSSIIWSSSDMFATKMIESNDEFLKHILTEKVGKITGAISKIITKQKFPLSAHINDKFYNNRLIYLGDSAHSIHPIAGQGWNLGVKDIKNLNFICAEYILNKKDIGDNSFCKRYNSLSYKNAFQLYQITDKLNYGFKIRNKPYRFLSNVGFSLIENNKFLKNKIANYAMGF